MRLSAARCRRRDGPPWWCSGSGGRSGWIASQGAFADRFRNGHGKAYLANARDRRTRSAGS